MSKQTINTGSTPNDFTGDTARDGGDKINDNFTELYDQTVLTSAVESGLLNSRRLLAGTNVAFDDAMSGERTINTTISTIDQDSGEFTAITVSSFNPQITFTLRYRRVGHIVNLRIISGGPTGTSNATSFVLSGANMPASIRPNALTASLPVPPMINSGSVTEQVGATVGTDGTITFLRNPTTGASTWTNSGTKGFYSHYTSFTYALPF